MQGGIGAALGLMERGNALLAPLFEQVIRGLGLGGQCGPGNADSLGGPAGGPCAVQQFAHDCPYLFDLLMDCIEQIDGLLAGQKGADIILESLLFRVCGHVIGLAVVGINHK